LNALYNTFSLTIIFVLKKLKWLRHQYEFCVGLDDFDNYCCSKISLLVNLLYKLSRYYLSFMSQHFFPSTVAIFAYKFPRIFSLLVSHLLLSTAEQMNQGTFIVPEPVWQGC